jgi:putative ABC transport system ATP-binding protein
MSEPHAVIAAESVARVYGKGDTAVAALQDISFSLNKGETVAIIGKSGSGKSTLMHILALLDRPTFGKIKINGKSAGSYKGKELDLLRNKTFGFVFQQFFLNADDTVLNNVMLPLKIAGVPRAERLKRAMAALHDVELTDKANQKANDLSGGQKQRVCIARAIVNRPAIIFADEPTGNLDTATGDKIVDLLFEINKQHHATLIIVTHDPELAARCGRQIQIRDGKIVAA